MKTNSVRTSILRRQWLIALITACLLPFLAEAQTFAGNVFTIAFTESNGNVVANASGTVDLSDLSLYGPLKSGGAFSPDTAVSIFSPTFTQTSYEVYYGMNGPSSYGGGGLFLPTTVSGDATGFDDGYIYLPPTYTSGDLVSSTATFDDESFSSLGITPGVYTYTYGSGSDAGEVILETPEPTSCATIAVGLLCLVAWRRVRLASLATGGEPVKW